MFLGNCGPIIVQIRWPADESHPLCLCRCKALNLSSAGEVSAFCFFYGCAAFSFISFLQWVMRCLTNRARTKGSQSEQQWFCDAAQGSSLIKASSLGSDRGPLLWRGCPRAEWALLFPLLGIDINNNSVSSVLLAGPQITLSMTLMLKQKQALRDSLSEPVRIIISNQNHVEAS